MTDELIGEVFPMIHGSDRLAELKDAPGLCIQSAYPEKVYPSAWAMTLEEIRGAEGDDGYVT